jgi:anthranilate synthase component 1
VPGFVPTLEEFRLKARSGNLVPVYREILGDLETPVSAFRKIDGGEHAFLLESVEGGEKGGRYSFLGAAPTAVLRIEGTRAHVSSNDGRTRSYRVDDPIAAVRDYLAP